MFAAQRQAQNNTKAFLQLLQSASPAVTSQTGWEEVKSCLGSDPVFRAVPAHQQLQIFQSYQAAVRKLEAAQRQRTAAAFQVKGEAPRKALAISDSTQADLQQTLTHCSKSPLRNAAKRFTLKYEILKIPQK